MCVLRVRLECVLRARFLCVLRARFLCVLRVRFVCIFCKIVSIFCGEGQAKRTVYCTECMYCTSEKLLADLQFLKYVETYCNFYKIS